MKQDRDYDDVDEVVEISNTVDEVFEDEFDEDYKAYGKHC